MATKITRKKMEEKILERIRLVDNQTVKTYYEVIVEDNTGDRYKWWEDKKFVKELNRRSKEVDEGKFILWEDLKKALCNL